MPPQSQAINYQSWPTMNHSPLVYDSSWNWSVIDCILDIDMADASDLSWCIPTPPPFHPYQPSSMMTNFNNSTSSHLPTPLPFIMSDIQPNVFTSAYIPTPPPFQPNDIYIPIPPIFIPMAEDPLPSSISQQIAQACVPQQLPHPKGKTHIPIWKHGLGELEHNVQLLLGCNARQKCWEKAMQTIDQHCEYSQHVTSIIYISLCCLNVVATRNNVEHDCFAKQGVKIDGILDFGECMSTI